MIEPRFYQTECVNALYHYFENNDGNPLCCLPTGTGKSVIIAMFLESIYKRWPNQKVLCVTHVKKLIDQNYKKLKQLWPAAPAGINSAGLKQRDVHNAIIFAGIASIYKKASAFGKVDLVIVDEAHLVSPDENSMYQKLFQVLKELNPMLKVVGFTATPYRMGQGMIIDDGLFTDICYDITGMEAFNKLIEFGYLCRLVPKKTQLLLNVDGVGTRAGDYIQSQLEKAVNKEELTRAVLNEMRELGVNRNKWLIFATGVEHAVNIAGMLNEMGENAEAIHSKLDATEQDRIMRAFEQGTIRQLVNYNMMTTGVDVPDIDLIGVVRHTLSPALWVQMLGRGTRPFEGKSECLVLDFAGNTAKLGCINDPRIPKRKGEGGGTAPARVCPRCDTYNHPSKKFCDVCAYEFPVINKFEAQASTHEIIKEQAPPLVEVFEVGHLVYQEHNKAGRPPSMRVDYYCEGGLHRFSEYIGLEHPAKWVRNRAIKWWMQRDPQGMLPTTTKEALALSDRIKRPTHLRVWVNKEHPEIMDHCFDGTAFNTKQAEEVHVGCDVRIKKQFVVEDASIPF